MSVATGTTVLGTRSRAQVRRGALTATEIEVQIKVNVDAEVETGAGAGLLVDLE